MKTKVLISLILAWFALGLGGCAKDPAATLRPDDGTVEITLHVSGSIVATRSLGIAEETAVRSIDMLAFNGDGKFAYAFHAVDIADKVSGNETLYKEKTCRVHVRKSATAQTCTYVFLANLPDGYISSRTAGFAGKTKAEVLETVKFDNTATFGYFGSDNRWKLSPFAPFPMWGEASVGLASGKAPASISVKLTRAVARVDVGLNFKTVIDGTSYTGEANDYAADTYYAQGLNDFKLLQVKICNVKTAGYVAPQGSWTAGLKEHSAAEFNGAAYFDATPGKPAAYYTAADQKSVIREMYIAEADIKNQDKTAKQTCILIEGEYNGNPASWYRVNFMRKGTSEQLDILRNHRYIINITRVNGNGVTEEEALGSDPVNLDAEVLYWDEADMDDVEISGQSTLTVTPRKFEFRAPAVAVNSGGNTFTVQTDVAGGWSIDAGSVVYSSESYGWLGFDKTSGAAGTQHTVALTATANTDATRTATFYVTAGRMRMAVTVTQEEPSLYAGYFAGEMKTGTDGNGNPYYKFEKKLWVSTNDGVTNMPWKGDIGPLLGPTVTNDWDGRRNTYNLANIPPAGDYKYEVASYCYNKNKGAIGSAADLTWYLPAQKQLMAIYTVQGSLDTGLAGQYWSSSEYNALQSWVVSLYDGSVGIFTKDTFRNSRGVRDEN